MSAPAPSRGGVLARVLRYLAPHAAKLATAFVLACAVVASTLAVPVLSGMAVDCALGPGEVNLRGLLDTLRALVLCVAATCASQWCLSALTNRIAYDVVLDMRTQAFGKLQSVPVGYVDSHRHGDVVNRVVTDVDQFTNGLVMTFQQFITGVLTIALTLGFMVALDARVTLVVVLVTPASILAARLITARGYGYFREQSVRRGSLADVIEEYVDAGVTVKALDAERLVCDRFQSLDAGLGRASVRAVFISSLVNPATRFVNAITYGGVGVTGALSVLSGGLTLGGLTAFLSYANQYAKPFNDISEVVTELQNSLACAGRLFELLDAPDDAPDDACAIELSRPRGYVRFDDVCFSYTPDRPLIEHVSLDVPPGTHVAIVGPTGCGKTTLINLLMRFYDVASGSISVDGHDVRLLTRASLRSAFGMVLQDTWLKRESVRDNIAFGRCDATNDEIIAAARRVHADEFIARLPQGLDTVLDGDSAHLSAGQRQLLCIARVLLADPAILILDEATSNIDTRTELVVQRAFDELMRGRTSFVVAHRLYTVRSADVIVAMRDGHVVEMGTHDELLARGGFYASLYNSQFS